MFFCFNGHMCVSFICALHSSLPRSWLPLAFYKRALSPAAARWCCRAPPGLAAPFRRGDFCGTRLQEEAGNALPWIPPVRLQGSINSACPIFSLLCWAHSVAEQCINIHGDQSRASRGRVRRWGVCVCGVCEAGGREGGTDTTQQHCTHRQQSYFFPTSLCRPRLQQKASLCLSLSDVPPQCVHTVDFSLMRTWSESRYRLTLTTTRLNNVRGSW